jgi:hypothetical protein
MTTTLTMRSQKISNRAPRPLKFNSSDRAWSGGRKNNAPLPLAKSILSAAKKDAAAPPAKPVEGDSSAP